MDNNNTGVNAAILERLEKVVQSLQDNSVKMGQLLAVHNEKLDKQDRIDAVLFEKIESLHKDMGRATDEIKKGCERDILSRSTSSYDGEKDVDDCRFFNYHKFCSITNRSKICKRIDSTTTSEYNTSKVITIE